MSSLLDQMIEQAKQSTKQTLKQKKIVETAITLFAEKGYSNTSTSEIAKLAEVSEGTIFKHYGTKDNLLLSVILPFIKESLPAMAEEVFKETLTENTLTFDEFLRAFLKNRRDFFTENKEIFKVMIKEVLYKEELRNEILPFLYENISPRLRHAVEFFKERGELTDIPADTMLKNLLTMIGGFFTSRFVFLNKASISDEEIEEMIWFVMNGLKK
ncbi:TetR/AcrR family transcriptional regulator [Peribacillus kribbensis]|uniref:TetR/AcrR family transcriptional regulator n=1 Tax=Peribacillus kribbensis TaxID=356658 RepID=UPI0004015039|nr:TetR/AcrR family transcriptional regulator [Peribacillus kribbensis]